MGTVTAMNDGIGQRVRAAIDALPQKRYDSDIAAELDLTKDAFSRSLSGKRAFTSIELAQLADILGADLHELITGEPDPLAVRFAARHSYNPDTRQHHVPDSDEDRQVLDSVAFAYRQAHEWLPEAPDALPTAPGDMRQMLGDDFVGTFAERVETVLGVHVVRVPGLSTAYSFRIDGHPVVVLNAQSNWFRSNFSLAHELAHLALDHHDVTDRDAVHEPAANAFASELLLPEADMRDINWETISEPGLALKVWTYGISTEALANRLDNLGLYSPPILTARPQGSTLRLLRRHRNVIPTMQHPGTVFTVVDPISHRYNRSSDRRIPDALVRAHLDGIATGRLNRGTLAWLLQQDPENLPVDEPDTTPEPNVDDLIAIGL